MQLLRTAGGHILQREVANASPDRRADQRIRTVYHIARAITLSDQGLCRVQNISDRGIKITTGLALGDGDAVWITLSETVTLAARVIWTSGKECGLELDEPVDCAALLQEIAQEKRGDRARPPRLPVNKLGVAISEYGMEAIRVLDISQRGMKITHKGRLQPNGWIKIQLDNGLERRGVVRWAGTGVVGIWLIEPIPQMELDSVRHL